MKKSISIVVAMIVLVCAVCFSGCYDDSALSGKLSELEQSVSDIKDIADSIEFTDAAELNDKIASLEQTITANKQEAEQTISALTTRISTLESSLSAAESEIASLKSQVSTLSGTVSTLSQTVQTLKELCESETNGNAALKSQIDLLVADIELLESNIEELGSTVSTLSTKIGELETALDEAELRLDIIEGAMNIETPYYNMGEVCTVKSASGLELYRVRLLRYDFMSESDYLYNLTYNIQNINMPSTLSRLKFFSISAYNVKTETYEQWNSTTDEPMGDDFTTTYYVSMTATTPPEDISHFIVGLPSDNSLSTVAERRYIIPYAIYNLHSD